MSVFLNTTVSRIIQATFALRIFFFVYTHIIDGLMIENIERCGEVSDSDIKFTRLSHEELESYVREEMREYTFKSLIRKLT